MKSLLIILCLCLLLVFAYSCEYKEIAENTEITIEGKTYKVELKEVTSNNTLEEEVIPEIGEYADSVRPPITNLLVKDFNGTIYLTDSYAIDKTVRISEYWVKENGYWVYYNETRDFPLNVLIESYPYGGEFGVEYPPYDFNVYIQMADGTTYVMRERSKVISINSEAIRIFNYFVREKKEGRWYFHETIKDLSKNEARIL